MCRQVHKAALEKEGLADRSPQARTTWAEIRKERKSRSRSGREECPVQVPGNGAFNGKNILGRLSELRAPVALSKKGPEESRASERDFSVWLVRHMPFLCLPYKGSVVRRDIAKYEINCVWGLVLSPLPSLGCPGGRWLRSVASRAFSSLPDWRFWGHFKAWLAQ